MLVERRRERKEYLNTHAIERTGRYIVSAWLNGSSSAELKVIGSVFVTRGPEVHRVEQKSSFLRKKCGVGSGRTEDLVVGVLFAV